MLSIENHAYGNFQKDKGRFDKFLWQNTVVIGKMKDGTEVAPVLDFVQLKSEIYSSIK